MPKSRKGKQRAVVDTNVVVAGISGFRDQYVRGRVPSADLMYRWADEESFVWLYSEDILAEYKEVLRRLHVRPALVGAFINLVRERGEAVDERDFRMAHDGGGQRGGTALAPLLIRRGCGRRGNFARASDRLGDRGDAVLGQ